MGRILWRDQSSVKFTNKAIIQVDPKSDLIVITGMTLYPWSLEPWTIYLGCTVLCPRWFACFEHRLGTLSTTTTGWWSERLAFIEGIAWQTAQLRPLTDSDRPTCRTPRCPWTTWRSRGACGRCRGPPRRRRIPAPPPSRIWRGWAHASPRCAASRCSLQGKRGIVNYKGHTGQARFLKSWSMV